MDRTIQVSGFPSLLSAKIVTKFLEEITGKDTVYALEVKHCKRGSKTYARVQFTESTTANWFFIWFQDEPLIYESFFLNVWKMDLDMVPRPKTYMDHMEDIIINFGNHVSENKFLVLWTAKNVSFKVGAGMKKLYFMLCFHSVDYKLELARENISEIILHYSPHGETSTFLVIQLLGAPRIFKKLEESLFSYFKETPDDHWVRTIDFTESCIGQSSSLCLEIPYGTLLLNFSKYFVYHEQSNGQFLLENGHPCSHNLDLVPIVHPPQGRKLPYKILFRICCLVQNRRVPWPKLDAVFFLLVDPEIINVNWIERALEILYNLKECCYEPVQWLLELYAKYVKLQKLPKSPTITLDDGLVYIRRVQITPSRVLFRGPEVNVSNRVLRKYAKDIDNFLRVSFVDEELDKMYSTDLSPRISVHGNTRTEIYDRILSTLRNGICIGDKKFEFLAFSSSQLRENCVWMFASRPGLTSEDIRSWMGDFCHIRNVAKYAARLGQSFSSSRETLNVHRDEIEIISDIVVVRDHQEYVFSDGIGKISSKFAQQVAIKCGLNGSIPSAFQIRYGGFKGVVAVDPTSSKLLSLRRSMRKYFSDNTNLDVLGWTKYQPCFLNRQVITLLSTLGVKDGVFLMKQRAAVSQLNSMLTDRLRAHEALELMSQGENANVLKEMLQCGYEPKSEPFLCMMLQIFRASKLKDLRIKTRIFIPNGRLMMGCMDETKTLEYGQVFVQFSSARIRPFYDDSCLNGYNHSGRSIREGKVIVAKNPCLHPGDIRVLEAVDVPALHHMVDSLVFPQQGKSPHPNECSGSDLDGDLYFVCWDPDLIPRKHDRPMDYTPAPSVELDHDVTIQEVEEYFANYMVNDSLGIISNAHIVFADREPLKARSDPCLELAKLSSIAVDFPKTGVPAEIPSHLRVKEYPDFMEKPDKPSYESQRVIGKLFRETKDIIPDTIASSIRFFTEEVARTAYDPEMEVDGFEEYINKAFHLKDEYDYKLGNLMDYYGIKTEAEILSGCIMQMSKSFSRKKDGEAIAMAVKSLRKEARAWFNREGDRSDYDADAKASAWYHVTYHPKFWGRYNEGMNWDHFISFPWCMYHKLIGIKRMQKSIREALEMPPLELQLKI